MSGKKNSEHGKPAAVKKLVESKEEKRENNSEMAKEAEEQNSFQLVDFKIEDFVCPLSLDLMQDPVIAADGHSYERADITQWLSNHNTSPLTNQPLSNRALRPNTQLQAAIRNYQDHSLRFTATQQELHSVQVALAMERKEQERSLGTTPGESSVESVTEHKQRLERELAELQTESRSQARRFENEQQAAQQRLSVRYQTAAAVLLGTEEKAEGKEEKKAESALPAALPALLIEATGLEVVTAASRQTLAETSLRAALNRRVLRKTLAKWTTSQSAKHKAELAAKTQGLLALDDAMHRKDYKTLVTLSEKLAEADKQASTDHKRLRPQRAQLQETLLSRGTRLQGLTQAVKTSRQALDAAAQAQTVLFAKSVADLPSPVLSSASVSVPAKGVEGASVAVKAKDEVKNGTTGLLQAASSGDLPRLQWLLKNGASLAEKTNRGDTALLWAAQKGKLEMVQWLLKNGASFFNQASYLKQQEMSAQLHHKKTIETRLAAAMSLFESQRREHAATMQELGQKVERLDAAVAQAQSLQERKRALPLDPTMVDLLKNWQTLEAKAATFGGSAAKEKMATLDAKISAARQKNDFAEMAQLAKAALAQQQAEAEIARQRTELLQTAAALTATKSPLQRGGLFERKLLPAQAHPCPQAMLRYQNTLFEEQVVAGDGNCGFTSLGTSREEVTRLFLGCAADIMARQELADEIQGLLRENRESALHTPETRALFIALDATQIKIDNQVRELNNQLELAAQIANPSQPFQRYGLDALIDFLGTSANPANQASVGKLCAARANLADMNRRIKEHCQSEALFKHYVTKELGGTGWLGYRSAKLFAKLKNYNVYIYRKSLNQPGTLEQVEQQETLRPINTFHLLHTDGYTHYNLLVQATPSASLSSSPALPLPGLTSLSYALNPLSLSASSNSSSSNGSALSSLLSSSASFFPPAPAPLSQANKKRGLPAEEKEDPEAAKEKQEEERSKKARRQSNTLLH